MIQPSIAARDHGLALISRLNRWLIAGAVALSGFISLVAAHAFHGRTVVGSSASASAIQQSQSSSGTGGSSGLQAPSQPPASGSATPGPVITGGS